MMDFALQLQSVYTLARWLGPWASEERSPKASRTEIYIPSSTRDTQIRAWVYQPIGRPASSAYLIAPGLHFDGPENPRMDRFASILAASGSLVVSPFIADHINLRIQPQAYDDFTDTFEALLEHPQLPPGIYPGIFSVSLGSWLAFKLAADPAYREQLGAAVIFGGYIDWHAAIDYALTGMIDGRPIPNSDPRNMPPVMLHCVEELVDGEDAQGSLSHAWKDYVQQSWDYSELNQPERYEPIARKIASQLPDNLRPLFMMGCGFTEGAADIVHPAFAKMDWSFLDPVPHLANIHCPLYLMHGVDDRVIHYTQLENMIAAMPPHICFQSYLSGLYGHSSHAEVPISSRPRILAREMTTMLRMIAALIEAGCQRR